MSEMSFLENSSSEDEQPVAKRKSVEKRDNGPLDSDSDSDFDLEMGSDEAETTLVPSNPNLLDRSQSSGNAGQIAAFKQKLSGMVNEHKSCLKRLRQEDRANNEEFFALVTYHKTGELPAADNTTAYEPVIHEGINLMLVPAGASAAKFGRHLACAMYGKGEECKLQNYIIGAQRRRKDVRLPVDEEERAKFELVVRRKYPKFPEAAYKDARHAANQMGLDIKLKILQGKSNN